MTQDKKTVLSTAIEKYHDDVSRSECAPQLDQQDGRGVARDMDDIVARQGDIISRFVGGDDEMKWYHDHMRNVYNTLKSQSTTIAEQSDLIERLRREAEFHSGEARGLKASLHEAYQAASGGTGEKGNWNGAKPIIDALVAKDVTIAKQDVLIVQFHTDLEKYDEEIKRASEYDDAFISSGISMLAASRLSNSIRDALNPEESKNA